MKTLILVPSRPELEQLLAPLPEPLSSCPWPVYPWGKDCFWALCGIGPAAAAFSSGELIRGLAPERVILAGIGGAFRQSGLEPGDLVQASSECFADLGYRDGARFYNLDHMKLDMLPLRERALGCHWPLHLLDNRRSRHSFLTVSSITNSVERAEALRATFGAGVENMEGAAVAMACSVHGIACSQIRAVSNWVGPRNPSVWKTREPLARLRLWLEELLATPM